MYSSGYCKDKLRYIPFKDYVVPGTFSKNIYCYYSPNLCASYHYTTTLPKILLLVPPMLLLG